jgi:hypothetical protein
MTMLRLGDVVELHGQQGRIIDVCPDTGDLILQQPRLICVPLAEARRLRCVERASPVRHYAMRLMAFALRVRDCGVRYAIEWPNN